MIIWITVTITVTVTVTVIVNIYSPKWWWIIVLFNLELPIANSLLSKAAFLEITWRTVRTSNLTALQSSFAVPLQSANGSLIGIGIRVLSLPGSEGLARKHLTVISSFVVTGQFHTLGDLNQFKKAFRKLPPSKMLFTSRSVKTFFSQLLAFSIHLYGV